MLARALALFVAGALACAVPAAAAQPLEQSVKAAFLTKFAHYISWPANARAANAPVRLCVIGSDPYGKLLDQAAASAQGGARITVHRVPVERAGGCHVAFVRGASAAATGQILERLRGQPVLTVTDGRFGSARGMVHFELANGRVGFHVDDGMAGSSDLQVSSRLLQLALSVKGRGR